MITEGITWHALTLEPDQHQAAKDFFISTVGLTPAVDTDAFVMFQMPNGTMLELYTPASTPPYGYNGGVAFGFRVDDIEQASAEIKAAGYEPLAEISRMEDTGYAYRHFRGPGDIIIGLNEQK